MITFLLPLMTLMAPAPAEPLRCNLNALNPEERALHGKQTQALMQAIRERQELPNGYKLKFQPAELSAHILLEWISHERRCCEFLRFDLTFDPGMGPVWLTLTGPDGTKEILKAAFQPGKH